MKKKMNYKKTVSILFTSMIAMMTSCVQGDLYELYEDDNIEQSDIITRNKLSKDGMNGMNVFGSGYDYPAHSVSGFYTEGCLQRSLNESLGDSWVDNAGEAINKTYNELCTSSDPGDQLKAADLYNKYYAKGYLDPNAIANSFDDLYTFISNPNIFNLDRVGVAKDGMPPLTPQVGDIILTKSFSVWHGPSINHCSYVTSVSNGFYTDSDGNHWSTEFIGQIYRNR